MIKFDQIHSFLIPKHILWFFCAVALIITIVTVGKKALNTNELVTEEAVSRQFSNKESIANPDIIAQHAVVWDKKNDRVLYEKNADTSYPIASITKLLTAIAGLENIPENTKIMIGQGDLDTEGESGLIAGESWDRNELITFMLITSSNDAAQAVMRTTLQYNNVSNENAKDILTAIATKIGMTKTKVDNPTGLDTVDGKVASNYASAYDIVRLLHYFNTNYSDIASRSGSTRETFTTNLKTHIAKSTNLISLELPHIDTAKTGYTNVAGGNLSLIAEVGPLHPIYIVVLGSTYQDRFSDTTALYLYSQELIQS